jgi:hypothetical protein
MDVEAHSSDPISGIIPVFLAVAEENHEQPQSG